MRDVIGIGALNLDILYEVEDLNVLREGGLPLCLGRETSLPPVQFRKLMRTLERVGTLK